ncbi:ATPase family AAA domain-containing protein 2-like [Schistocerca serialis cubense]|uniref:ATPase family AAA domain-containing protein 2-like n=1 Tax=Schistocerca serialis cubense TaxID=2023355 RepID=UPI00214F24FA|nr:ATPase family AAA domain-containing protein 2-like [Schistocerca serialis cubense]
MDNVNFNSIGGLEENIQYLKDAILLPWRNQNIFKRFHVKPPRGVLFHGPPGTGKTLTAAALANECKRNRKKVSFFHQNGAECLTMWLGESERKIRELFKNAYLNRPAIIFFDELDAVAPIRSKRQDHVHASVVSTLLTLMDGLKSPQDVVVIGATNRLDEIDPALRRPGRFDKELFFPPPDLEARRTILNIHTRHWHTDTSTEFMDHLAENTAGYCGADLEALCTEALMCAMKRSISSEQSTAKSLMVHEDDFIAAKSKFVPAYLRSSISPACSLSEVICPLLQKRVESLMQQLEKNYSFKFVFPKQSFFPFITIVRNLLLFLCPYVLQNFDSNSFSASCVCVSARIENNFQFIFYFCNALNFKENLF